MHHWGNFVLAIVVEFADIICIDAKMLSYFIPVYYFFIYDNEMSC